MNHLNSMRVSKLSVSVKKKKKQNKNTILLHSKMAGRKLVEFQANEYLRITD